MIEVQSKKDYILDGSFTENERTEAVTDEMLQICSTFQVSGLPLPYYTIPPRSDRNATFQKKYLALVSH